MEKKDLTKLLDEIFVPIGFKRKGNNWVLNNDELSKVINLQKSSYSNAFYINYGYIIKGLKLDTTDHVGNRLASSHKNEQKIITDLLNLESNIPDDLRLSELKTFIKNKIVVQMQLINSERELFNELIKRPNLNDIPLVVKRHFNLQE